MSSKRNDTTFGVVLGWSKDDPKVSGWYGTLRHRLAHVRKAAGYMMVSGSSASRGLFSRSMQAHLTSLSKNSTREAISHAYESIVIGLSAEVTALDTALYESAEVVKKQDAELNRLRDMNRDMGHREMKAHDQANIAKRKTEALLTLIAETTKDQSTVDEFGNVITPTGGWQ